MLVASLAMASLGMLGGCAEEQASSENCVTNEQFFAEEAWTKVFGAKCVSCHNPTGAASNTRHVLQDAYQTGFLEANYATLRELAKYEKDGKPLLLLKPTGGDAHEGGSLISEDSEEYRVIEELVERFEKPVAACSASTESLQQKLVLMSPEETLRAASLSLVGRLPTESELQIAREGGLHGVDAVILKQMEEEAFLTRVKEVYNDLFLTDRYLPNNDAVSLLSREDYPNLWWYEPSRYGDNPPQLEPVDPSYRELGARFANRAVAREALELVAHVVREDRPFTEVITADYIMANPFSARVYGVHDTVEWNDPTDPNEFREVRLKNADGTDFPHAGVLTSHMWLNRFPTTPTNLNRHRSRMVWRFFLATDVLKLAERPIDPTAIVVHNPTRDSAECNVCHANIDPIAGAFRTWSGSGRYTPEAVWPDGVVAPGFGSKVMPATETPRATQWLAEELARDPRFVTATVHTWYKALTGRDPLSAPTQFSDAGYTERMRLYLEQDREFQKIGEAFVADNYNLKTVIRGIISSPYYRAKNAELDERLAADPLINDKLDAYGMGHFLTPEQLNRKIVAVTGYPWRPRVDQTDYLLDTNQYRIFYGGIDSDSIIARIDEPNGLMGNVAARMANQMSCLSVPQDFVLPKEERLLFPLVELGFVPEDANGFEVASAIAAIKANIQYLHRHVLGEDLPLGHAELERTYQLFYETWREGRTLLANDAISADLDSACRATRNYWTGVDYDSETRIQRDQNYTVRAWMAVMTYLLSDYRFLHE